MPVTNQKPDTDDAENAAFLLANFNTSQKYRFIFIQLFKHSIVFFYFRHRSTQCVYSNVIRYRLLQANCDVYGDYAARG